MPESATSDLNLKPLFTKLGHSLEEIRARALQNVLSKLEHNLICDADIVQERHLHIALLEWFNFTSCPLQDRVLSLILRLSKHPSAANIYVEIGAVEFLTQLRSNVDSGLSGTVDAILDQLFHLPSTEWDKHSAECIFKQSQHPGTSQPQAMLPSQFLEPSLLSEHNSTAPEQIAAAAGYGKYPSPPDQQLGYFGQPVEEPPRPPTYTTQTVPAAAAICFKFSTFPLVALTLTDRHVLSSTDNSLRSTDVSLVISACEFLSDVVFQDFPAEVFLQRPSIVKSLLSLLVVPAADKHNVSQHAVQTLRDLASSLEARIYYYQDPSLYTPKQEFSAPSSASSSTSSFLSHSVASSDTRPSVVGDTLRRRGDGQDGDNSTSSAGTQSPPLPEMMGELAEQTDLEDIQSLQFLQWTTPQFCVAALERLLPCLKTPNERYILHGLELLHQVAALLKESVVPDALWEDQSLPARELIEKLHDILEMMGDVLYLHHHGNLSASTPQAEQRLHRVAFVGLSVYFMQLLNTILTTDKALRALPEPVTPVLTLLAHDESLSFSFPSIRATALELLQIVSADSYNLYAHATVVCDSLRSTCSFLCQYKNMNDESVMELLMLAEESLLSLPYHLQLDLVAGCVQLASYIGRKTSPSPLAVQQSRRVLLTLLAHPLSALRLHTYAQVLHIIKDCLGVEHVVEPATSTLQAASFLLDQRVLYELTCFGCSDPDDQIRKIAEELLLYLLQSQLLMPATRWQQLLEAITGILPVLQAVCDPDTPLSSCMLGLMEPEPHLETGTLPMRERLRCTLRLMFSHQLRQRTEGLGKLAWFLAHEEDATWKLPLFSELDVSNLANLFLVDPARSLVDEDTGRSVFKADGLRKVYEIFTSDSIETTVRHSAGEQLAVIMQDHHLHPTFTQLGGVDKVLSFLRAGIKKPKDKSLNTFTTVLPAIVKMLRSLVQHDSGLRHQMAHQTEIYFMVLRAGLLHQRDSAARQEVAELTALLLFDETAQVSADAEDGDRRTLDTEFGLPSFILKKYRLPFKPPAHHLTSPNRVALPPESDPLATGSLAEMLRMTWNVAWNDGIEAAIQDEASSDENNFSKRLHLSAMDRVVLRATYIPTALQQCVRDVENATSHQMVMQAVQHLSSYVVSSSPHDISDTLHGLRWKEALARFFLVVPSSNSDEQLLGSILQLMTQILLASQGSCPQAVQASQGPCPQAVRASQGPCPQAVLDWFVQMLHHPKGALLGLLGRREAASDEFPESTLLVRRHFNRHLLKFVHTFVGRYPYSLKDRSSRGCVRGDLTKNLLKRINRTEPTHFYILASLESTLLGLMHVTARPGWSVGCETSDSLALCQQMLQSLLEVISAFHVGRVGASMSYMGRGVTRCATLCLRHLAFEMATQLQSPDWPRNWLFSRQATADSVGESGLHWLIPLWSYRDTEVRAAGLGIAAALASTESGRITMTTQCQHIPGGIWGTAFSLLLDQSECSLVRQQAALLLVNLTSQPMPSGSVETAANVWQGPIVRNEETQVSLVGLSALLALLHHSQFYQEMMVLLTNFYPQPAIHPVSVAGESQLTTPLGSQTTITTSGSRSVTPAGTSHLTDVSSTSGRLYTPTPVERPATVGQNGTNHSMAGAASGQGQGQGQGHHQGNDNSSSTPASMIAGPSDGDVEGADRSATSSASTGASSQDYQSVATPCLVSAVCRLLSNLVAMAPQDTLACISRENVHKALIGLLDVKLLEAYVDELKTTEYRKQFILAFKDLLLVHADIVDLLRCCAKKDVTIRQHLLADTPALTRVVKLLGITSQGDSDSGELCCRLWESVFSLFCSILQQDKQDALQTITPVVVKYWTIITGRIVCILQDKRLCESSLWVAAQNFLALLLAEEGKLLAKTSNARNTQRYYVVDQLDKANDTDENDLFVSSSGALLCQALVKMYDTVSMRPLEQCYVIKMAVVNALKSLLTISATAKVAALEAGLVETVCVHVRHVHMKLSMDALDISKVTSSKKKENPLIAELMLTFDLLRNFMYGHSEVKMAAYECNLGNLLHQLWAWCQMEPVLMNSTLQLLATFTARCSKACSSLAFTSPVASADKLGERPQHTSNSLVHCLVRLLLKETAGNVQLLRAGFAVLSTLTLSQECRGILWKSNFLQDFAALTPTKPKKTKVARVLESLWLDLLVNLSFSVEGQDMILKINGAVCLLLDFGLDSSEHNQRCAVLVLRNLCFHTANKPKLLANEKLLPFLLRCIEAGSPEMKLSACSAVLALVHNSQKAKGCMKNTHILRKLQDSYNHFVNLQQNPCAHKCAQQLHDTLILLQS